MLAPALCNYLLRLGWSHGDEEIISRDQAIAWFELKGVGRAPARFDPAKLENLNAHYLREMPADKLVDLVMGAYREDASSHTGRPMLLSAKNRSRRISASRNRS